MKIKNMKIDSLTVFLAILVLIVLYFLLKSLGIVA